VSFLEGGTLRSVLFLVTSPCSSTVSQPPYLADRERKKPMFAKATPRTKLGKGGEAYPSEPRL